MSVRASRHLRPVRVVIVTCAGIALASLVASSAWSAPSAVQAATPAPPAGEDAEQAKGALDTEESLARFQQLLQRRPFHGPAFTGLVTHYIELNKLEALVAEYKAKSEALPDDVALKIVLARLYLRSGDTAKASELIRSVETLPPALARLTSELLVFKSEVFQRSGDNASAETMLTSAMAQAASVSEELKLAEALADLYLAQQRGADAIQSLKALAAKYPTQYLHQRHIADALAQRSLYEAAVEQYQALLPLIATEVDKRCESLRQMGLSLEKLGKREEAIAAYTEAVGLVASDHWLQRELHERIVNLYRASNRLDDLATYCRAQIARAPEQTAMRVLLADVQAALGKPDDAKATLAEAVELFPADIALSQKRLDFLERAGDVPGALAEHQRIISRHSDDAELYITYGQYLAANKQVEAARNQWEHVLQRHVTDAALANRLGTLFETNELFDDAVQAYDRAIELAPQQPDAYLALSRQWMLRANREKAVEALQRAATANQNDGAIHAAVASGLISLGQAEPALAAVRRACELSPTQVRYRQTLSDLLVLTGRLEDALVVRREAIDLMTNPVQQAEAIGVLVSMHASADTLQVLEDRETKLLERKPDEVAALLLLSGAADARRDFTAQRRWLDRLLAAAPGNEIGLQGLARLQDATADVDAAVVTWKRIIQLHPQRSKPAYDAIVDLKLRYGDKAGAIEALEQMIAGDPGNTTILNGVAEQLQRMGDSERALPYYEQSLKLQPQRHETRLEYGKALAEAGRLEEALVAFKQVATQQGDTDSAIDAMSRLHDTATQLGSLEELIDDLEKEIELNPSNTLAARALAQILIREFEYGRAMTLLDVVIRNNPRDVDLAIGRAELLRRLAQFDKAIEAYQTVLRHPQVDRDFVVGEMGKAHFEAGQLEQAKRLWKQVQNRLYAGSLLKNNGLLDEAVTVFEEGIRLKPDDYAMHRNLILALEAAGRTEDALKAARRLLDLEPDNAANIMRVAEAHLKHGDRGGAAEVAARLFSASVLEKKSGTSPTSGLGGRRGYYGYGYYGTPRSSLDRGIEFFVNNGMLAELAEALEVQMTAQPSNAVLRSKAADLFAGQIGKPDRALALWRELEAAEFPLEYQSWLGECSQRDSLRMRQYGAIASMPAMRDAALARLGAKKVDELSSDERLEFAVIRNSQGNTEAAIELLKPALDDVDAGTLARGALIDMMLASEKYADAEPHLLRQVEALATQRAAMHAQTVDRVRRDFVRTLPLESQLRMTEEMIDEIAQKRTLGNGFIGWNNGGVSPMGFLRARLGLATVYAKTKRMEEARAIWKALAPSRAPDVDTWTMLGSVAQLYDQDDVAYDFYRQGMQAARTLAQDPLLRRIYASTIANAWYYEDQSVDQSFNKIVAAFAERDGLIELYDFLRDTDQPKHARRIADQYKLDEKLEALFASRVTEAATAYRGTTGVDPFDRSIGYFAAVNKLVEVYERRGSWDKGVDAYRAYLKDFPDELQLLTMLGQVAEAQLDLKAAVEWEKQVLEAKTRLARRARQWNARDLTLTPSVPQALTNEAADPWGWRSRWRTGGYYGYGGGFGGPGHFDRSESWMRLAQLYLADRNPIASGDAMSRAVADAGTGRDQVIGRVLGLIQERQLAAKMLPVLRSLAVYSPNDEKVQLAFSEALEANERPDLAIEVCQRMLRRGVTDLGVLAQVRSRLEMLAPDAAPAKATLASLEAEVAADPTNLKGRLQLGKAYYYSLDIDKALAVLETLAKEAPHMEDVHPLIVELHTLRNDTAGLIDALKTQIDRTPDETKRRAAQWRLTDELLAAGKNDEAVELVQRLGDTRDPNSYSRIAALLHYFGRHDEALKIAEEGRKSQSNARYYGRNQDLSYVSALLKGDLDGAVERILRSVDEQAAQQVQYGGARGSMYSSEVNPFAGLATLIVLDPKLADELKRKLEARRAEKPGDPQSAKLLMSLHRVLGRPDLADTMLEQLVETKTADQTLLSALIDRAVRKKQFERAIAMAEEFIAAQPKPQLDPGVPAQYAGQMIMQSPRTYMACKLGDVYWEMGRQDKAFEAYKQIIVERADETRVAYATICLARGRIDEARAIIEESIAAQQVKSPDLLKYRAFIAALDNDMPRVFDCLAEASKAQAEDDGNNFNYRGNGGGALSTIVAFVLHQSSRPGAEELQGKLADLIRERIAKTPGDWSNYESLMSLYRQTGQPAKATAVLDQAAAVASLAQRAAESRLQVQLAYAPAEELIALYEKSIELAERGATNDASQQPSMSGRSAVYGYPTQPNEPRVALGELYWNNGDRERALQTWTERRNLKAAPTHAWLGEQHLRLGDKAKAESCFRSALKLDPENVQAHLGLADLCTRQGNRGEAFEHMLVSFARQQNAAASASGQQTSWWYSGLMDDPRMNEWALDIAADSKALTRAPSADSAEDPTQGRIMMSLFTGDWSSLEKALRERVEAGTFDPLVWKLWAHAQERRGDWEEAAKAWEFLRRARKTTVADHRTQLQLALAGKQIKEAAAGTRQANTPGMPAPGGAPIQSSYYGGYPQDYYYGADNITSELAAINVRLGRFADAERLHLLSSGNSTVAATLPAIAELLWQQRATDRALELMRLSIMLSGDARSRGGSGYGVTPYAAMLSESGKVDESIDLLVRAYRMGGAEQNDMNQAMYGYYYPGQDQQLEQGDEAQTASALYAILNRTGRLEQTLAKLSADAAADPTDVRLSKLLLSLKTRAQRWGDLKESIIAWRAARPQDLPLQLEELHAEEQLGQWDSARAMLAKLQADSPKNAAQWRLHGAFIDLMTGKPDDAVSAIEPLLADTTSASAAQGLEISPQSLQTVLVCAQRFDRLAAYLEMLRTSGGGIDSPTADLLIRTYERLGRRDEAFQLAAERLWRQSNVLTESDLWYRALERVVHGAAAAGKPLAPDAARPQDGALLTLVARGPEEGRAAFLAAGDSFDALRGTLLAQTMLGDVDGALAANTRLIQWLEARRRDAWYWPPTQSLRDIAQSAVQQMSRGGAVGVALGRGTQIFDESVTSSLESTPAINYEQPWRSHQILQRDLLARGGEVQRMRDLLRDQKRTFAMSRRTEADMYDYGLEMQRQRESSDQLLLSDPDSLVRALLWSNGRFSELFDAVHAADRDLPSRQWALASDAEAAAGQGAAAADRRRAMAKLAIATMIAGDAPNLSQGSRSRYRWSWYSSSSQEVQQTRQAMRGASVDETPEDPERTASGLKGPPDDIWEAALLDPGIAQALQACDAVVGPGWESTRTLGQLVSYYDAKKEPAKIVALLERVYGDTTRLHTELLAQYLRACFQAKDYPRLENVLARALEVSSALGNDVATLRLVVLRQQGKTAEADTLEAKLLKRCVSELPNPAPPQTAFVDFAPRRADQGAYQRYYRSGRGMYRSGTQYADGSPCFSDEMESAPKLARALGVRFQQRLNEDDLTLERLARTYRQHGLYADAARLSEQLVTAAKTVHERLEWHNQLVDSRRRAGQTDLFAKAASSYEAALRAASAADPSDASIQARLGQFYAGEAGGRKYAQARQALQQARKLDSAYDPHGLLSLECIYKEGLNADAWRGFASALRSGKVEVLGDPVLFYAALSGMKSGQEKLARPLLRLATHRYPTNVLSAQAREVSHD